MTQAQNQSPDSGIPPAVAAFRAYEVAREQFLAQLAIANEPERDLAHESDMAQLRRDQLRADIDPSDLDDDAEFERWSFDVECPDDDTDQPW